MVMLENYWYRELAFVSRAVVVDAVDVLPVSAFSVICLLPK